MKARPLSIFLIASLHWLIAPALCLYHGYSVGWDWSVYLMTFSPTLVFVALSAAVVGFGIWRVRVWGYLGFMALSAVVVAYLVYLFVATPQTLNYASVVAAALLSGAMAHFLQGHMAAPYFNPNMRWWERSPRFRIEMESSFEAMDQEKSQGCLRDISVSGCFAELESSLGVGDIVSIRLGIKDHDLKTKAKVIWHSEELKGYGFMFLGKDSQRDRQVTGMIQDLVQALPEHAVKNQGLPLERAI